MMSKIPTLLAIFILTSVIGLLLFTINQIQSFTSSAQGGNNPIDVRVTNITSTQAVVTWLTDTQTAGFVNYFDNQGDNLQSDYSLLSTAHYVLIQNLKPSTIYSFKINSLGQVFGNNNSSWQFQTLNDQPPLESTIVSGEVLTDRNIPAKNAIVYVAAGNTVASALVSASGSWVTTLPQLSASTQLIISVFASPKVTASAKVNIEDANPVSTITLGNSYDFTNQTTTKTLDSPSVPIQLP